MKYWYTTHYSHIFVLTCHIQKYIKYISYLIHILYGINSCSFEKWLRNFNKYIVGHQEAQGVTLGHAVNRLNFFFGKYVFILFLKDIQLSESGLPQISNIIGVVRSIDYRY
jgi:hypothetical protein